MKEVGFTSHTGVLLSQINRYHITNVGTFLKPMLIIEHVKMIQMLYLDIRSMLLSGQVPYRTNSSQLFWNGLFQKKNRGDWGHFFVILCTPGNSRQNKAPPPEICYNYVCYIPRKFQGQKIKTPGNFTWIFLGLPWKFHFVFN